MPCAATERQSSHDRKGSITPPGSFHVHVDNLSNTCSLDLSVPKKFHLLWYHSGPCYSSGLLYLKLLPSASPTIPILNSFSPYSYTLCFSSELDATTSHPGSKSETWACPSHSPNHPNLNIKGDLNLLPPHMPLWHGDCLSQRQLRCSKCRESSPVSLKFPFVKMFP